MRLVAILFLFTVVEASARPPQPVEEQQALDHYTKGMRLFNVSVLFHQGNSTFTAPTNVATSAAPRRRGRRLQRRRQARRGGGQRQRQQPRRSAERLHAAVALRFTDDRSPVCHRAPQPTRRGGHRARSPDSLLARWASRCTCATPATRRRPTWTSSGAAAWCTGRATGRASTGCTASRSAAARSWRRPEIRRFARTTTFVNCMTWNHPARDRGAGPWAHRFPPVPDAARPAPRRTSAAGDEPAVPTAAGGALFPRRGVSLPRRAGGRSLSLRPAVARRHGQVRASPNLDLQR